MHNTKKIKRFDVLFDYNDTTDIIRLFPQTSELSISKKVEILDIRYKCFNLFFHSS